MDKILQRARQAIKSQKKKLAAEQQAKALQEAMLLDRDERISAHKLKRVASQARRQQREDWRTGALLAPRRDVGVGRFYFGAVPALTSGSAPGALHAPEQEIHPGERVVILVGRHRGKIGEVKDVQEDRKTCTIKDINKAYQVHSDVIQAMAAGQNSCASVVELPYRLCDVRLVARVGDRDVIVDYRDKKYLLGQGHKSLIPGSRIELPEPVRKSSGAAAELVRNRCDTEIIDVEEQTELQELTTCPMPASVIDELRNKYGRFRTRHEPDFVGRVESAAAAEAEQAELRRRSALTPADEARLMWKLYRREAVLTDDMLERIGRVMVAPVARKGDVVKELEREREVGV